MNSFFLKFIIPKSFQLLIVLIMFCFFIGSCKKFVSIPPPEVRLETSQVFGNDQSAIGSVVGLYSQFVQSSFSITNGGGSIYPALSADEIYNTAANVDYDAFRTNNIIPVTNTTGLNRMWQAGFRNIYHVNAVIEGLTKSTALTDSVKSQLMGEMLVARAFNYLYLVNLYGDLPLITTISFGVNEKLSRSSVASIYQQITTDLVEAKMKLKSNYPSSGRVRPNKLVAIALLARVYLYLSDWENAAEQAAEVINSGTYSLGSNLNNVFLASSNEAIWQVSPTSTTLNTIEGNQFNPPSSTVRPTFAITDYLLNSFELGDLRKTNWLRSNIVSGITYHYPYKYKVRTGAPPYTELNVWLRLAEMYLIRAEAKAQLNDLIAAKGDLNKIRNRAGLTNSLAVTQGDILSAIAQERRVELFTEWGHRWLDLKRTKKENEVLSSIKNPNWQPTDVLYPIAQYELDTNPFLVQNPGY